MKISQRRKMWKIFVKLELSIENNEKNSKNPNEIDRWESMSRITKIQLTTENAIAHRVGWCARRWKIFHNFVSRDDFLEEKKENFRSTIFRFVLLDKNHLDPKFLLYSLSSDSTAFHTDHTCNTKEPNRRLSSLRKNVKNRWKRRKFTVEIRRKK